MRQQAVNMYEFHTFVFKVLSRKVELGQRTPNLTTELRFRLLLKITSSISFTLFPDKIRTTK